MQGITFTIQNPDSKPTANAPVIYYDEPKASKLTFLLTQNLGIKQLNKGDTITIHFPASLLQSLSTDNVLSKGWDVKTEQPSPGNQNRYSITLSATGSITFGKSELAINLQMLQGKSKTNGDVTLQVRAGGAEPLMLNSSVKLFVLGYPDQPQELDDNILFPSVTFNDDQAAITEHDRLFLSKPALQPPIANRLTLNLKYSKNQLVEKWDANERPFFNISFSYGSSANDLTDRIAAGADGYNPLTSAYNIVASSGENDRWQVLPESGTNTTIWKIVPTASNHHLFTEENDNLDVILEHIISRLAEGNATIYIQWGNIPGYNDGWKARNIIKKKPAPRITAFTGPKGAIQYNIKYGAGISLEWDVFAAPKVQLRCDEAPYLNQRFDSPLPGVFPALVYCGGVASKAPNAKNSCGSFMVKSLVSYEPVSNFYLQALDEAGTPVGDEVGPVTVSIDNYPAPAFKGNLLVREAIPRFTITKGKPTFYIRPGDTTFTLVWQLEDPEVVETITIVDSAGKTIKTIDDTKTTQVSISYQQDGAYQITLNAKKSGHSITERFVVNRLFSSKQSFSASIPEQKIRPPITHLVGDFTEKLRFWWGDKLYSFPIKIDAPQLHLGYQLTLRFQRPGTGTLTFDVQENWIVPKTTNFNYDNDQPLFHPTATVTFLNPSVSLSNDTAKAFTWTIQNDGSIHLHFPDFPVTDQNWILRPQQESTPENLIYQFSPEENPCSIDWLLPVSQPPQTHLKAQYHFQAERLNGDLKLEKFSNEGDVDLRIEQPLNSLTIPIPVFNISFK